MNNPNLSLIFYKYTCSLNDDSAKKDFLQRITQLQPQVTALRRRLAALQSFCGHEGIKLVNNSRFLCGVGYDTTLEWGFSFDWTTGHPWLPGSSLKGALLSYLEFLHGKPVEDWNDQSSVALLDNPAIQFTKEEILSIFGPQGTKISDGERTAGSVCFYDVFPVSFSGWELDVITPHYKRYYSNPAAVLPDDTENPVPLYFLTVKRGSTFCFLYKLRNPATAADSPRMAKIEALIREAGQNYGFGAKTSSGFGYFENP